MITPHVELCGEDECHELQAFLVERIYEFNAQATGYFDGRLVGGRMRSEAGEVIAAFNAHTWGGCCVVAHLWVRASQRGRGLGRALLQAAEAEAVRRSCEQMVLSTHSFQAPAFYERLGYEKQAVVGGQPKGHASIIYVKRLKALNGTSSVEWTSKSAAPDKDPGAAFGNPYAVEDGLYKAGAARAKTVDANHFLYLVKTNQWFSVGGDVKRIKAKFLFVPAKSDPLFPPWMARRAADTLRAQGNGVEVFELEGDGGHYDGFFQISQASAAIRDFLGR